MKKGSFKCLVMREFYMCRGKLIPLFIVFVGMAGLVLLVQLGFKVGNLALLPEEVKAEFMEMFSVFCLFPIAISNVMLEGVSASSAIEGEAKWKRFRLASPVSPVRFAAAKYAVILALFGVTVVLVAGYIKLIDVMDVVTVDEDFVAISMAVFGVMLLYEVVTQVLALYFGSVDKAGMTMMGVTLACMFVFFPHVKPGAGAEDLIYQQIVVFCKGIMPYVPVCIVAVFVAGFGATTMLYKRREK